MVHEHEENRHGSYDSRLSVLLTRPHWLARVAWRDDFEVRIRMCRATEFCTATANKYDPDQVADYPLGQPRTAESAVVPTWHHRYSQGARWADYPNRGDGVPVPNKVWGRWRSHAHQCFANTRSSSSAVAGFTISLRRM
ncbi:hypothetical protein GCM10027052_05210 [Parafrigoribacterium mesophilum]